MITEEERITSKIATILELLNDGKWHLIEEIQQKAMMDKDQIHRIIEFLEKYGFVLRDETKNKLKLERMVQKFLTHTTTS